MSAILFSPHNDDEVLFACYQLIRHKPRVVIVLRSYRQLLQQSGPDYRVRERETDKAMQILGCDWEQWEFPDTGPDWVDVSERIHTLIGSSQDAPDVVISPAWLLGGHEDHNTIGSIVEGVVGDEPVELIQYLTYRRGYGREQDGVEVVATEEERALKLEALACYRSQAAHPPTSSWFSSTDQREFIL